MSDDGSLVRSRGTVAKEYFEKFSQLVDELKMNKAVAAELEVRHFFSGAALYANNVICASWSPVGLAFKLAEADTLKLIESGEAKSLKYFDKGKVKKGYALFENPQASPAAAWEKYLLDAIRQSQNEVFP